MSGRIPAEVFHPSEFIKEEMDARGWSADELAMRLAVGDKEQFGVERLALDLYFEVGPSEPGLRLGEDNARMLAAVFDVSPEYFLNLERAWLGSESARTALSARSLEVE